MSFKLSPRFLSQYDDKQPEWGFGALSYLVYKRTYARIMADGKQEEYRDTCKRVAEGVFTAQKNHCKKNGLEWLAHKAQKTAQEFFRRMWDFKFTPPGRGFWIMGTPLVDKVGSAALNNCGFTSTKDVSIEMGNSFSWAMDMLMLGVGVGFDTKGAGQAIIKAPRKDPVTFEIPDSREGWVESVRLLINSYQTGSNIVIFDYSKIRPRGKPIRGFGGTASGPGPLKELHENIIKILDELDGETITSVAIVDIMNFIGKCVVAGNVRRCLPSGSMVHTKLGLVEIEKIKVGHEVLTSSGYQLVKSVLRQGVQKLCRIITEDGHLDCTPNHRIAVLNSLNSYEWKMAKDLESDDRLMTSRISICGSPQKMPLWNYNKPKHSTTCVDIQVPELDADLAWLIGLIHGDGYVYANKDGDGFNAYISIVCGLGEIEVAKKAKVQLERFGVNVSLKRRKGENSYIVHVQSKQLAWYLYDNFKQPNTTIRVPDCIKLSTTNIRLAYFAGVFDSQGAANNRPVNVSTVYQDFAIDLQRLLYSCGLESRLSTPDVKPLSRPTHWKKQYFVKLITKRTKAILSDVPQLNKSLRMGSKSSNANGFPSEWVPGKYRRRCAASTVSSVNIDKHDSIIGQGDFCPTRVICVEPLDEKDTFDIEVSNLNEFYCNGYLVHNSAELAIGEIDDVDYIEMKDKVKYGKELCDRRWASNNSVFSSVYSDFCKVTRGIGLNGEPGLIFLDNARHFGRLKDGWIGFEDDRYDNVDGFNPCAEQCLEDKELCTLVETYPANHDSVEDYHVTLKYAYMYAKTITLIPTHDERTNSVMMRNRRIGCSMSGIQQAIKKFGLIKFLKNFCDKGYDIIRKWDRIYSRWLGVPRSIRMTTIKPSGTVSILAGATPGVHFTHSEYYWRLIRIASDSPLLMPLLLAGYRIEVANTDNEQYGPGIKDIIRIETTADLGLAQDKGVTLVVYFPVKEKNFTKSKFDVTLWEQLSIVREMQYYWSDNSVSCTITFKDSERNQLLNAIEFYASYVKTLSFLPLNNHGYIQAPYTECTKEEYESYSSKLGGLYLDQVTETKIKGSKFCTNDTCEV